ncbi:hypothetical protein [Paraburkholderia sp. GAS32]|uniref:hypothetical protein n=1 Tax=Paraburkholderia sp. GAS32 TaxID=3035129 RepID=UPI003D24421D
MGHISQDAKKAVATQLKTIMPKGWKWSLAVRDYCELSLTIASAPVDLLALYNANNRRNPVRGYVQMTNHGLVDNFKGDAAMAEVFGKILAALKGPGYFDRSDSQQDITDVAHYIRVNIGKDVKPFAVTAV